MTTLRLLLGAYATRVLAGLLAAVSLLALADFADLASGISAQPDALSLAFELYLHKLPGLAGQALPLALLFGVLLALADLAHHRELLALRSVGAGAVRLAWPAILLAVSFAAAALWVGDRVAPAANRRVVELETRRLQRWNWYWTVFHKPRSWYLGPEGEVYHVEGIAEDGHALEEVTVYATREGRLLRLARADRARWEDGAWRAEGVRAWRFDPAAPEAVAVDDAGLGLRVPPRYFAGILGQPDELTLRELAQAVALRRAQGQPTLALEVEARSRVAMPLLGLALVVLALGIGLGIRTPGSAVEAATVGIGVSFLGWMLLALFRAMGLSGMLPPWAAAWTPVVLLTAVGTFLLVWGPRSTLVARLVPPSNVR